MTSSTTRIDSSRPGSRRSSRGVAGFTLTELIIGMSLSLIVLAGVFSAFLMLGRSGMNVSSYSVSEAEIRRGIEEFSQDVRMASAITWNGSSSITLTVPENYTTTANQVTYAYDNSTSGSTAQCFYRKAGNSASTATPTVYVRNVSSFQYLRFNRLDVAAANDTETKRIQISMNVRRTGATLVAANTTLVSASFIMRNKVTN